MPDQLSDIVESSQPELLATNFDFTGPVATVNGAPVAGGNVPGPVTRQLMSAFSDLAGMDYVDQYLSHLQG